ncbi:hypothetical protein [Streptomyces marincola]|uniref:DUF8175 domain-containing protein n=1 Tax=Streptomyces marincola TaxID=2878388 RepID=A0A1W7CWJ2_9ACTN|nr:hypothetical protein [Streptomyces marincola]ARQ69171.1 hypothetical protein CAG99_10120 [Streptomyces marincola]
MDQQPHRGPEPRGTRSSGGRRWKAVVAAAGGGLLALAVLTFALPGDSGDESAPDGGAAPGARPWPAEPPRGQATAAAGLATRTVSGLPRGFPRSEAGAVEAGASYASSVDELYRMSSAERWAYAYDARLDPPSAARLDADAARSSATGVGAVCRPELGAYRVVAYTGEEAVVDHWMPCLVGTEGRRGSDARTARWQMGRMALLWEAGDWRVTELARGPFERLVLPAEPDDPATRFAERLALLGEGWELYADATEHPPTGTSPAASW